MELLWNDLSVLRLIHRSTEQVEVAGSIPPPGGCRAAELLDCSAEVEISNCKTETGKLNFEGRLCITIAAADETGDTFAFVGEIPFSHCTENADFAAGMLSNALPAVAVLDMRLAADGAAAFSANVNIDFIVTSAAPVRVLSGVSGVADMEIKSMQCRTARRVEIGSETIRFSEELSSEGADSVLSFSAQISVRDTAIENGGTSVSGIITLNALLKTSDGELMQLTRGVPFRESLSAAVGADEIYTVAELKNVSLRALGTEFSLLAFDADIDFRIFGIRRSVIDIPTDAYSPSLNFSCMYEKMTVANACGARLLHIPGSPGSGPQRSARFLKRCGGSGGQPGPVRPDVFRFPQRFLSSGHRQVSSATLMTILRILAGSPTWMAGMCTSQGKNMA